CLSCALSCTEAVISCDSASAVTRALPQGQRLLPQTPHDRLLRPLPRLRGRDREGACNNTHACKLTPPPTPPPQRGGGREPRLCGACSPEAHPPPGRVAPAARPLPRSPRRSAPRG